MALALSSSVWHGGASVRNKHPGIGRSSPFPNLYPAQAMD